MTVRNLEALVRPRGMLLACCGPPHPFFLRMARRNGGGNSPAVHVEADAASLRRRLRETAPGADLAVLQSPAAILPGFIGDLAGQGIRSVLLLSPESESDPRDRQAHRQAALDAARPHLMRFLGPGLPGLAVPGRSMHLTALELPPQPGHLAFLSQSTALLHMAVEWSGHRKVGFSQAVAFGDMWDIDLGDMLDYCANDAGTEAILIYAERVTNAAKFLSAARSASRAKPVAVLQGRPRPPEEAPPGQAEATADAVYEAAFQRAGLVQVGALAELFDAAQILARRRNLTRSDLAIVSNGRALSALAADSFERLGGRPASLQPATQEALQHRIGVPPSRSPLWLGAGARPERLAAALDPILADPSVGAAAVFWGPGPTAGPGEIADVLEAAHRKAPAKLLLTALIGEDAAALAARARLEAAAIPAYGTIDDAVRGFMYVVQHTRRQSLLMETPPSVPADFQPDSAQAQRIAREALERGAERLSHAEARQVLSAYGIGTLGPDESLPREIAGFDAAMFHDPLFGPVLQFAAQGSGLQPHGPAAHALPPLNMKLARELVLGVPALPGRERAALADEAVLTRLSFALVRLSQLTIDVPQIHSFLLSPLLSQADDAIAAVEWIKLAPVSAGARRLAIRPYPKELEESVSLADGRTLQLRPVRPEDEPALRNTFRKLSPQSVRLRFFSPLKDLSHQLAARLTQIDYDREMALVLADPAVAGRAEIFAVVRVAADPDGERGEFALTVRDDVAGMGLGRFLMQRIIDYVRAAGLQELFGEVMRENRGMLAICRRLGFTAETNREDPTLVLVRLPLKRAP